MLLLAIGIFGRIERVMHALPTGGDGDAGGRLPLLQHRHGHAVVDAWHLAVPMVAAFVLVTVVPPIGAWLPPVVAALLAGVAAVLLTGGLAPAPGAGGVLATPVLQQPPSRGRPPPSSSSLSR